MTTFRERYGLTREQLRRLVAERRREQLDRKLSAEREELERLGQEFRSNGYRVFVGAEEGRT